MACQDPQQLQKRININCELAICSKDIRAVDKALSALVVNIPSGAHSKYSGTPLYFRYANDLNPTLASIGDKYSKIAIVRDGGRQMREIDPCLEKSCSSSAGVLSKGMFFMIITQSLRLTPGVFCTELATGDQNISRWSLGSGYLKHQYQLHFPQNIALSPQLFESP